MYVCVCVCFGLVVWLVGPWEFGSTAELNTPSLDYWVVLITLPYYVGDVKRDPNLEHSLGFRV